MNDLITIVNYIVRRSNQLKNKLTGIQDAPVEFVCIFCQNEEEYGEFTNSCQKLGKIVQDTPSGFTYLLEKPIKTEAGFLKLLKIRKPDPERKERGDADFNTDYKELKKKYQNSPKFELVKRDTFEMLRLSDPKSDVMACFSSSPLSKDLGIKL